MAQCRNSTVNETFYRFYSKQLSRNPSSSQLQEKLKLLRKKVKSKIRHEAKEQGLKALASKNPRDPWNYIKLATFTSKADEESLPPVSSLNDYFASVVQATTPDAPTVPLGCDMVSSFPLSVFPKQVNKALSSIKTSTAPGHEQIPGFVIQKLAYAIAPNLTVIYNSILQNNIIPKSWKMAQVRAIYKREGKTDPSNY